jgi:hypothetical protein
MTAQSFWNNSVYVKHKFHIILSCVTFGGWFPIYVAYFLFCLLTGSTYEARTKKNQLQKETKNEKRKTKAAARAEILKNNPSRGYSKGGKWGNPFLLECNHSIVGSSRTSAFALIGKVVYCDVCKEQRRVTSAIRR